MCLRRCLRNHQNVRQHIHKCHQKEFSKDELTVILDTYKIAKKIKIPIKAPKKQIIYPQLVCPFQMTAYTMQQG